MASDAPPTSMLQPEERNYSQVVFSRVEQSYVPGIDIICYFTYTSGFHPAKKDWVGIFKVSWKTTREYYTWVSADCEEQGLEKRVTFKAYYLPKESDDYYQFCYVDQKGEVRGVSIPFQLCRKIQDEGEEDILLVTTEEEAQGMKEKQRVLEEKVAALEKDKCTLQDECTQLALEQKNKAALIESLQAQQLECAKKNEELDQQNQELERQLEEEKCKNGSLHLKVVSAEEERERVQNDIRSLQLEQNQLKEENMELHKHTNDMEFSLKKYSEEAKNQEEEVQELKDKLWDAEAKHHLLQVQLQDIQMEKKKDKYSIELLTKEAEKVADLRQNLEKKDKTMETMEKQLAQLQRENATVLRQMEDLSYTLELRKAEISDMQQQRVRDGAEIEHLNRLLTEQSSSTPRNQGLFFQNPYESESLISFANEPQPGEAPGGSSVRHVQMQCPECGSEFENFQVFQDHIFCHDLESTE
ncbi:hypothetical protein XENTR_v10003696 [Xenopus tropicalis]|uniref:Calcium-binding and coiled-coil domain-containing protein 2 n=1 Tax=Xenopus tropicalis TaxID=8364 RepID=CACO2_XENTR|eukprot:NP_001006828.1 calcium-binding and coiled-coil domain-containing protein 2 [Xenopus tropicalis]